MSTVKVVTLPRITFRATLDKDILNISLDQKKRENHLKFLILTDILPNLFFL